MMGLIVALGAAVAVVAAARSTWSPCGLSMLSSITVFGERARGQRYWVTASWFIAGAVLGGAVLGVAAALLAAGVAALGLGTEPAALLLVACAAGVLAAAADSGAFGDLIPLVRRQVDDRWLRSYRGWAYGFGFGAQVGVGLATYVMTAGVFLMVALGVLSASPLAAWALCAGFGLARGLTVLLTSRAPTPASLRSLHRRVDRAGPAVRLAAIGVEVLVAVAAAAAFSPYLGLAVAAGMGAAAWVLRDRLAGVGNGRAATAAVTAGADGSDAPRWQRAAEG